MLNRCVLPVIAGPAGEVRMRGLFRRKPRAPFPDDMLERLDRLGRSKIDIMGSGVDWPDVVKNCIAAFYEQAMADPDKFLSDLTRLTEDDTGGFATYGAVSLMIELIPESRRTEVGGALLDRAIEFKIRRGLPLSSFIGYELARYDETVDRGR
jgi:hypothetical protein